MNIPYYKSHSAKLKISKRLVTAKLFNPSAIVVYSGRTAKVLTLDTHIWDSLSREQSVAGYIHKHRGLLPLLESEILVPLEEDELATIICRNIYKKQHRNILNVAIFVTGNCNLGCIYCGQKHVKQNLSTSAIKACLKEIARRIKRTGRRQLRVSWFGGEPLIALNIIRTMTSMFYNLCRREQVSYSAKIVTNGVLLNEKVAYEMISKLGVDSFTITLDGPQNVHDRRRFFKTNRLGTFNIIINNVKRMIKYRTRNEFELFVRCNLDESNIGSAQDLINVLNTSGLASEVKLYFRPVYVWGDSPTQKPGICPQTWCAEYLKLLKYMGECGFQQEYVPNSPKYCVCLHDDEESLIVGVDGHLYTCTEIPLVPKYYSKEFHLNGISKDQGLWNAGSFDSIIERPKNKWDEKLKTGSLPCSKCAFIGVCKGSCPKQWREGNVPCPWYTYKSEEVLKQFAEKDRFSVINHITF